MAMVEAKTSTTESSPKAIRASACASMPRAIEMNTSKRVPSVGQPVQPDSATSQLGGLEFRLCWPFLQLPPRRRFGTLRAASSPADSGPAVGSLSGLLQDDSPCLTSGVGVPGQDRIRTTVKREALVPVDFSRALTIRLRRIASPTKLCTSGRFGAVVK